MAHNKFYGIDWILIQSYTQSWILKKKKGEKNRKNILGVLPYLNWFLAIALLKQISWWKQGIFWAPPSTLLKPSSLPFPNSHLLTPVATCRCFPAPPLSLSLFTIQLPPPLPTTPESTKVANSAAPELPASSLCNNSLHSLT